MTRLALAVFPLLAAALPATAQSPVKVREFGTLANNVYHHNWTGTEFTLPAGWTLVTQGWGDIALAPVTQ
jgi:hypothetical protein